MWSNLVLGGFANPSGISAADFYAALFLADDAFHDGLLPTYDFADGGVLTPSSYLIRVGRLSPLWFNGDRMLAQIENGSMRRTLVPLR
jgi:hypothetical protein